MFDEYYRRTWEPENDISPQQTTFATSLRVPILSSEYPRWHYITGIVVRDEQYFEVGIMPTEDEIALVGAHLENYCTYYNQSFRKAMRDFAPYDIDGGANLGWYMKRPDGGWCYRKRTWEHGPHWWPRNWPRDDTVVLPLDHVIARNFSGWSFAKAKATS